MKRSNVLIVLFLVLFFSVSATSKYYKFFVLQDYTLVIETSCDSESENCFVFECEYGEDEECEPYKYIELNAKQFSDNNLEESEYGLQCSDLDFACTVVECSADVTVEGETCIN